MTAGVFARLAVSLLVAGIPAGGMIYLARHNAATCDSDLELVERARFYEQCTAPSCRLTREEQYMLLKARSAFPQCFKPEEDQ